MKRSKRRKPIRITRKYSDHRVGRIDFPSVCAMDSTTLLQEFEDLAERMSIRVRYGKLDGDGGLCRYRDRYHIVINKRLDTDSRINLLGRAFSAFPLENVFLIPAVRDAIDRNREQA